MDNLDRQEKEFKTLGINHLFRGPMILTLLSLAIIYIVYQHNQMLKLLENNRNRESEMQSRLYEKVIEGIAPELKSINSNIQIANQKIDSVTSKPNDHDTDY